MKALIFDSSPIISLALNDLLYILKPLKKIFGGEFFITENVKYELIDRSLGIKKFKFEALVIQSLINQGVFKIKNNSYIENETKKLLNIANNTFKVNNESMRIIHEGEASCLALYNFLPTDKKAIVIDERTTRMLCESPENLHKLFESKLHRKIEAFDVNFNFFKRFKIIRSTELAYVAYKKGIIVLPAKSREAIEAILYALKYKGCSISHDEIREAKNY
ncbi:MAG: hypothetical protein N3G19_02815 [Candidatus Pacearchaeota archaeon]|nr:hypothetical protein [Candidatus Pacearchaeota archaeon]